MRLAARSVSLIVLLSNQFFSSRPPSSSSVNLQGRKPVVHVSNTPGARCFCRKA